jgi:FkbM family methyltransferase
MMKSFNGITDSRYGTMIYNTNDYVIGRSIKEYGEWCQGEIELLKEIITPGMTVIDAGANIGTHSLAFSSMVGSKGKVLAFEPQRHIFHILAGNVAINSIQNIWCYYNAVSDEHVIMKVKQLDFEASYNFGALQLEEGVNPVNYEEVPAIFIDELPITSCGLIKADVEGMEEKVLRGAVQTIEKNRPFLYVENERPEKSESLISYIKSLDYQIYWHCKPAFNPINFKENKNDVLGGYVPINLFCIPKESSFDASGYKELVKG